MNRRTAHGTTPDRTTPANRPPPLEAEVRADDLEASAPEEAPASGADVEATPGEGENAAGFLKRRKR